MKSRTHVPAVLALAVAACLLLPTAAALAADHADHADPAEQKAAPARPAKAVKPVRAALLDEQAGRGASAPAAPAADPMDQLRSRLADKLSGARATATAGPNDLRVVAKAPPAAKVAMRAAAGHGTSPGGKAADTLGDAPHWAYNGPAGPQTWGGLKPEFALCANGQRQSPIDIRGGLAVDLEPVKFDYQATRFGVIDNGHTVQVNVPPGNNIEVGGRRFELKQFHFHRPSEERIDGRQFEMSLHLVHADENGRLAVVAVLFDKGQAHAVLQRVWNNLPLERNDEAQARATLDATELLPADRRYFTYMGSLTTPPCSEGVQWVVMRQPVTAAVEQIELFARIYPMNARPIQAASGRRIMQSN